MPPLSNFENMEQLRKAQIMQAINIKAGAFVYESTKLETNLADKIRKKVAQCIWEGRSVDSMPQMPQVLSSKLEGINCDLDKLKDSELANVVRKRLAKDILAAKYPNLRQLVAGTALATSKHLYDEECVLESEHPPSQNSSSLSLVLCDSSLISGNANSNLEAIRDVGRKEAETNQSDSRQRTKQPGI